VKPIVGRTFVAGEDVPNGPQLAVLSETFWQRRFNRDRSIIGKPITLDGVPTTVIGVLPSAVTFPSRSVPIDAWVPLQIQVQPNTRLSHAFFVVGRLRPGATLAGATTEMKQIASRLADLYPVAQAKRSVLLKPLTEATVGPVSKQLYVLFGAAAFVLLIACANAASLLLARAASRQREVAVLAALGANRWRVAQQFLIESILLSACGAVLGFVLSRVAVRAIIVGAGTSLPRSTQIHFDLRVVAFIAGAIVLTTLLFGLVPALHATRTNLQDCLRGGSRGDSATRGTGIFRSSLVVGQFALSLVLLAGAGLLLRTFAALLATPSGMVTEHVLTMRIPFPLGSPRYKTPDEALDRFYHPLLARLHALPGVQEAGLINLLPLQQTGANGNFTIVGETYASVAEQPFAEVRVVSPGYFSALHVPVLRGRDVSVADRAKTEQVVVVNQQLVMKFFHGQDPIGRSILIGPAGPNNPPCVIVGVVGSVHQSGLNVDPSPELYFPTGQASGSLANMTLVVRTSGDPVLATKAVVGVVHEIDSAQPVYGIRTMEDVVRGSVASQQLYLGLLGTFAGIALLLAVAGIYGVMAYSVSQRTREFGIRLALGSETSRVQRLIVWQGARLAIAGLAIGLPAAFLLTKLLGGVLYGVAPNDPLTFGTVAALLAVVSVVASYLPSRRVTAVDPIIAMRAE
jgi:predicted permease